MWSNKSKNSSNNPILKTKIPTIVASSKILTPDGFRIMVGASETLTLIYKAESSLWDNIPKTTSNWTNKSKLSI